MGFPGSSVGEESACHAGGRPGFDLWVRKIPWQREALLTPIFWPGAVHGLHTPRGQKQSDMTEQLSLHLKMSNGAQTSSDLITIPLLGSKVTHKACQRTVEQVVEQKSRADVSVCECAHVRVRACVGECVRVRECACVCVSVCTRSV